MTLIALSFKYLYYDPFQVILAFSLLLAYDLLEDRYISDVIISKFFPPRFKMTESFGNLDKFLRDWAKHKVLGGIGQV